MPPTLSSPKSTSNPVYRVLQKGWPQLILKAASKKSELQFTLDVARLRCGLNSKSNVGHDMLQSPASKNQVEDSRPNIFREIFTTGVFE